MPLMPVLMTGPEADSGAGHDAHGLARRISWALVLVSLVAPGTLWAATYQVGKSGAVDFATIQAAIAHAVTGDIIIVHPGVYVENVDFLGKDLVLRSSGGPGSTTINGSGLDSSTVVMKRGESRSAVLEGFTITGGRGSLPLGPGSERSGGGIMVFRSSPTITNNVIVGNRVVRPAGSRVTGTGGGIGCGSDRADQVASPLIVSNEIVGNQAGSNGGGIGAASWTAPEIVENTFRENTTVYGDGGGIYVTPLASGTSIRSNRVLSNSAGDHGGGVYAGAPTNFWTIQIDITMNVVAGNRAIAEARTGESGGGIWTFDGVINVRQNTIVDNYGDGTDNTWGGGMAVLASSASVIERNIIAYSEFGGGIRCFGGTGPTIRNNLFWSNVGGDLTGNCPELQDEAGNLFVDPQFCGRESGDFRLAEGSPALSHPAGFLGALSEPGCKGVSVLATTWSALKAGHSFRTR